MPQLIGEKKIDTDVVMALVTSEANHEDTTWHAYENHDIGHSHAGEIQFLAVGKSNTIKEPPARLPDSGLGLGWRYQYVGMVDIIEGVIL